MPGWIKHKLESSLLEEISITLVAQMVKYLLAMRETRVQSLVWEDPLEKEMATHSSTLTWKILWTEEPGRLHSMGLQRVGHDSATSLSLACRWHHPYGRKWRGTKEPLDENESEKPGLKFNIQKTKIIFTNFVCHIHPSNCKCLYVLCHPFCHLLYIKFCVIVSQAYHSKTFLFFFHNKLLYPY